MLRFVTKEDYWAAEDQGWLDKMSFDPGLWHIKQIQDCILLYLAGDNQGATIVEVGGGKSRVLPILAQKNVCINVDELKGEDGGPIEGTFGDNITHIYGKAGQMQDKIPDASQDLVFSISVMEHIPIGALPGVYDDIARMLKPGGEMIHLADCYLPAPGEGDDYEQLRYDAYVAAFDNKRFRPLDAEQIIGRNQIYAHPRNASNPDRILNMWNQDNPSLRSVRAESQSATWIQRAIRL